MKKIHISNILIEQPMKIKEVSFSKKVRDLLGQTFGRLTVIKIHGRSSYGNGIVWYCKCSCGNFLNVNSSALVSGNTKSCGCLKKELDAIGTHGEGGYCKRTVEYKTWINIKSRCYNQKSPRYKNYGGKGIIVCDRWLESYENFLEDMGRRPNSNLRYTIERVDVNGNYEKSNCIWASNNDQQKNRTNNVWKEFKGKKMILSDWCLLWGINRNTFSYHLNKGKSMEQIYNHFKK